MRVQRTIEWKSLSLKVFIGIILCVTIWWNLILEQEEEEVFDTSPQIFNASVESSLLLVKLLNSTSKKSPDILPKNLLSADASQLNNLKNFGYLINHPACNTMKNTPTVIMMVHSAPNNFEKRNVIRETWGSKDSNSTFFTLLFILARVGSVQLQAKIEYENQVNGDIVQGNFNDAYRNLTYKHIMVFKWFLYNCPSVPFLLKTDDDAFINTPLLYEYLQPPTKLASENLLFCLNSPHATVLRYPCKWKVTEEEYKDEFYPGHCPGYSVLYSSDVVRKLYYVAQELPYFWIDDVFITGDVRLKTDVNITDSAPLHLTPRVQERILKGEIEPQNRPSFLFARPMSDTSIREFWRIVHVTRNRSLIDT